MADTYSNPDRLTLMSDGTHSLSWGDVTNVNLQLVATAVDGVIGIPLTGIGSPYTLTANQGSADQSRSKVIVFTGILTGAFTVVMPLESWLKLFVNGTSGGFDITISNSNASSSLLVPFSLASFGFSDATSVFPINLYAPSVTTPSATITGGSMTGGSVVGGTFAIDTSTGLEIARLDEEARPWRRNLYVL